MPPRLSRRAVLLGGAGLALVGAACGGDDGSDLGDDVALGAFFGIGDPVLVAGLEQRAVFGLLGASGPINEGAPDELRVGIERATGATVVEPFAVARHQAELPRPYYPVRFTVDQPGNYVAAAEVDGRRLTQAFTVHTRDDVLVPQVGDDMPVVPTPTPADHRGVEPICTAEPQCPLHEASLDEVLADGRPVAVLVSTPAFCQTAICGPVLDVLLNRRDEAPEDLVLVHVEVYADETASRVAPAVQALSLSYEPALFVAGADGRITARLDNIFDADEMRDALATVS